MLFIKLIIQKSKTSWPFAKAVDTQGFTLSATMRGQKFVY